MATTWSNETCCNYPIKIDGRGFLSTCRNPLHWMKPMNAVLKMKAGRW